MEVKGGIGTEIDLKWLEERLGPDIVIEEDGKLVSRASHYGWGSQITDRWLQKGSGVYLVELLMESMEVSTSRTRTHSGSFSGPNTHERVQNVVRRTWVSSSGSWIESFWRRIGTNRRRTLNLTLRTLILTR